MTETATDDAGETETDPIDRDQQPQPNPGTSLSEECKSVVERRPLLAIAIILVVGAGSYAGISYVARGVVDPLEIALFSVVFTLVYTGFTYVAK